MLDTWLGDVPLISEALQEINLVDSYKRVNDYWIAGQGWNRELLRGLLPSSVESQLSAFILREDEGSLDGLCWGPSPSGQFSVRTAYSLATDSESLPTNKIWKQILKIEVPQRIRAFIWLVYHGKMLSNMERAKRGFTSDVYCKCCPGFVEDVVVQKMQDG